MGHHCKFKKEGYVTVPQRIGENPDQVIPEAQIFYLMIGKQNSNRPTLFFIHGFGNDHETWACQQACLSKLFCTVAIDWRSVGNSSKTTGIVYNLDVFVDDFHEVIKQLGLKNVILVGQSIGSTMAMKYVVKYPGEIDKLIVFGGFPRAVSDLTYPAPPVPADQYDAFVNFIATDFLGFRTMFIGNAFDEICQPELANAKAQAIQEGWAPQEIILSGYANGWFLEDITDIVSQINVKTLVAYGGIDDVVPINNAFFLRQTIPGSTLVELPNVGHFGNVSNYKRFNRMVKRFILCKDNHPCHVCKLIRPKI
jgi:pimeloyl-ACP methyl ester carboxylesterase